MKIDTGVKAILRLCPSNQNGCKVGITDGKIYEGAVDMGSSGTICMQSFMKTGKGVQGIY
jgi:hypothetical protein